MEHRSSYGRSPKSPSSNRFQDDESQQQTGFAPPYSSHPNLSVSSPPGLPYLPGLPRLNYALYSPPSFKLSDDETTITSYSPELSKDPEALYSLIQRQATIPPKAQIKIQGWASGGYFDLKINMMSLLVGHGSQKKGLNYLKVVDEDEMAFRGGVNQSMQPSVYGGIDEWVQLFCLDRSELKEFKIQRTVPNWDTDYLDGQLRALCASAGSMHPVTITFVLTHSTIVVRSPHKTNKFFTNVKRALGNNKKYEVIKSVWPYASLPPGEPGRIFAVQSEESWWSDWKDAIRNAIVNARQGWVTLEDQIEVLMAPEKARGKDKNKTKTAELSNS